MLNDGLFQPAMAICLMQCWLGGHGPRTGTSPWRAPCGATRLKRASADRQANSKLLLEFTGVQMIRLRVKSLTELRDKHSPGDYVSGTVFGAPEGSFTISLYPTGDKLSNPGFIGVYLTCLSLKASGVRGVRVGATWNLLSEDGVLVTSRHERLTPILLTPDPVGDDSQLGKGRGYTNFYRPNADLDTFTLTCDFVVREVVREDGTSIQPCEGPPKESLDNLLSRVKRLHDKEMENVNKARVMTVEELIEMTHEDLLKLQENTHTALARKVELENKCSICLERGKDFVCVPCGHRFCAGCIMQVDRCAECRERIDQKLKCF